MDTVIKLQQVNFAYQAAQLALQEVDLEVTRGEFLGIIGPNGGGKTTLLRLLLGLLKPLSGVIDILGTKPGAANRQIGYVPQFTTFNLEFPISVLEVVLIGRLGKARSFFSYSKEDRVKALEVLQQLGIAECYKQPIATLSGGQLQRVMLARALVCEPKILLLDEPTANIDIHAEKNIFELLQAINSKVTILVVSHDLGFISKYIKRVACLNRKLICHDTFALTPEIIQQVYGIPIRVISHE